MSRPRAPKPNDALQIVQLNLAYDRSLASPETLLETYHTLTGDWRDIFKYIERTDAVSKADIRRVAADVFKVTNRTVARLENDAAPATGGTR